MVNVTLGTKVRIPIIYTQLSFFVSATRFNILSSFVAVLKYF